MLEKIFYLVGAPRTGSTLIYNAICSHELFHPGLPENHITPNLVKHFYQQCFRNQKIESHSFFDSLDDTKSYFKNYLEIFFNKISIKYNVNNLILKSIILSPDIHILYEFYPEISYVMIVRDPRDIIVSMLNVSENQKKLNEDIHFPRDMGILCDKINHSYRLIKEEGLKEFFYNKVYIIKYEDFIDKPLFYLNEISKKFSLNANYRNKHDVWGKSSSMIKTAYRSNLWGKPINKKRIGLHKKILTISEIDQINASCEEIIRLFKY